MRLNAMRLAAGPRTAWGMAPCRWLAHRGATGARAALGPPPAGAPRQRQGQGQGERLGHGHAIGWYAARQANCSSTIWRGATSRRPPGAALIHAMLPVVSC